MNGRRWVLRHGAAGALLATPLAALLAACSGAAPASGPVPVTLGRDSCTRCQMLLSDPRFVAEVRGGPGATLYKFDDIGCAATWLATQGWGAEAATRIWVAALTSRAGAIEWLDARRAFYLPGYGSPMGYNYGASATAAAGSVDFATLQHAALTRGY
jgi:nitrous oxide reductase accessory protein NosL